MLSSKAMHSFWADAGRGRNETKGSIHGFILSNCILDTNYHIESLKGSKNGLTCVI